MARVSVKGQRLNRVSSVCGRESSYLSESNNMIFRHFNGVYKVDDINTLYSRVKVLGAGSFGEVYEAINLKSNAACAVKVCAKERI